MKTRTQAPMTGKHIGGLTITKVIHEHQSLTTDESGCFQTLGQMFDEQLANRLAEGDCIQDITFHFDTQNHEAMETLRAMYRVLR